MGKMRWVLSLLLIYSVILSACGNKAGQSGMEALDPDEKVTLKVTYFNDQAFYMQYGNVFQAKYPNIEFEVIPTAGVMFGEGEDPVDDLQKIIDEQKPDIVLLTTEQYVKLAASGQLAELESYIKDDNFDIENMFQGVIDLLKAKGGGKLYGLSPDFENKAIFYNKDMFDKYKIEYPTDQMSWEEILKLAARFPSEGEGDKKTYGLVQSQFMNNPFNLVAQIGSTNGLSFVDYDNGKLTIENDAWKKVFQQVVDSYKTGSVYYPDGSGGGERSFNVVGSAAAPAGGGKNVVRIGKGFGSNLAFMSGNAAMSYDNASFMNMSKMIRNVDKESEEINYGVVTAPVDPANPETTSEITVNQIFSILSQSANQRAAWEFVKYVNSDAAAKINSKTGMQLQTRSTYISETDQANMAAFYKLMPNDVSLLQRVPEGFSEAMSTITSKAMLDVLSGSQTVDEALHVIQEKGQDELTKLILAEQQDE